VGALQTSEAEMLRKERGEVAAPAASEEVIYKIDIPANRYDMLCLEGIARALNVFTGKSAAPNYTVSSFESLQA
jgi:phenylalanyl-tRNA synthetase beta chain